MRSRCILMLIVCASVAVGQTTGAPGLNDMTINGNGSGGTSPVASLISSTSPMTWDVSGAPNSPVIGVAVALPASPGFLSVGAQSLDVITGAAAGDFVFDGTGVFIPANVFTAGVNTLGGGVYSFTANVPSVGGGFLFAGQSVVIDNSLPLGFQLTQAHDVSAPSPPFSICANTVGGDLVGLSDDGSINVLMLSPFVFYGVTYNDVNVNMNGNLTFGSGDTDFTSSEAEMLSDQPRIAIWDDWTPSDPAQGTVRTFDDGTVFQAEYFDVRHFGTAACGGGVDSNTFCFTLDYTTGLINLEFGIMLLCTAGTTPSGDQVVGISPGGSLSAANNSDLSGGNIMPAGASDAIYEDFSQAAFGVFDLAVTGPPANAIQFIPSGGTGIGAYIVP